MAFFKINKYIIRVLIVGLISLFGKDGIGQTVINGKLVVGEKDEILKDAKVSIYKNGNLIRSENTDVNGKYKIKVDPGVYEVEFSHKGFFTQIVGGLIVAEGQINKLNFRLPSDEYHVCYFVIRLLRTPSIKPEKMEKGHVYDEDIFIGKPSREINDIIMLTPGVTFSQ